MSVFICIASLLASTVVADFVPPRYVLDLNAPALERWGPIFEQHLKLHGWNASFGLVTNYMTSQLPMEDWKKYNTVLEAAGLALFGSEYFEEILGVYATAKKVGHGDEITTGMLVFFQLFYEFAMECTGIVARDPSGKIIHGRNMDIDLPVGNITTEITWVKDGEEVLISTQYLGYLGMHTGMRKGQWSVQANERIVLEPGPWGYQKTILGHDLFALAEHHKTVGYLLREALLDAHTFEDALAALSKAKTVSPLYFILAGAGANEGAVITHGREGLADNNRSVIRLSNDTRWLVQTNWDNWIPVDSVQCKGTIAALPASVRFACREVAKFVYGDPTGCNSFCQLTSDGRAEKARAAMAPLDPGSLDSRHIYNVLSTPPVLAAGTVFTSIMEPRTSSYRTVVRDHGHSEPKKMRTASSSQKFMGLFAEIVRSSPPLLV